MPKPNSVAEIEQDVEQLVQDLESDTLDAKIDLDKVDLDMPWEYEIRAVAIQRVAYVRDAVKVKIDLSANKHAANQRTIDELTRTYNALRWGVAIIDAKYPGAKAVSKEIMQDTAQQETVDATDARNRRRDAARR